MTALGAGRCRPPGRRREPRSGCYFLQWEWQTQAEQGGKARFKALVPKIEQPLKTFLSSNNTSNWELRGKCDLLTCLEHFLIFRVMVNLVLLCLKMLSGEKKFQWDFSCAGKQMLFAYAKKKKINSYYNKHFNFTCWLSTVAALHFHFQGPLQPAPHCAFEFRVQTIQIKAQNAERDRWDEIRKTRRI